MKRSRWGLVFDCQIITKKRVERKLSPKAVASHSFDGVHSRSNTLLARDTAHLFRGVVRRRGGIACVLVPLPDLTPGAPMPSSVRRFVVRLGWAAFVFLVFA